MQVCKAESHVLIQVYLNVGVSLHEFFHQTASVCAFEVVCVCDFAFCVLVFVFVGVLFCVNMCKTTLCAAPVMYVYSLCVCVLHLLL